EAPQVLLGYAAALLTQPTFPGFGVGRVSQRRNPTTNTANPPQRDVSPDEVVMIEIRHLKTLIALRETGSLVEAAERLFLTQSALSHQLKELESRLECELFGRKCRPLRFTEAGKRLLLLADEVTAKVSEAERDLQKLLH